MATHTILSVSYGELVGEILRRRREALDMKASLLGSAVGMTQSAWSRYETGRTDASLSVLYAACLALGCHLWEVIQEADEVADDLTRRGVCVKAAPIVPHKGMRRVNHEVVEPRTVVIGPDTEEA